MNLRHRILLLLYKYANLSLPELKFWLPDVKCEVIKAELIRLHREGLIDKTGKRGSFHYKLSESGNQYIEQQYLRHRFYELKLVDSILLSDFNMR
jgi:Mn-dependent DtxR family transcriptional regulator